MRRLAGRANLNTLARAKGNHAVARAPAKVEPKVMPRDLANLARSGRASNLAKRPYEPNAIAATNGANPL